MTEATAPSGLGPTEPDLTPTTILERRPGVDCAVEWREKAVAILMPWNEVSGPRYIAPALEFVRDHERFRVADLPQLKSDSSRLVLARRLVREGFLRPAADQAPGSPTAPEPRVESRREKKGEGTLVVVGSGIKSLAHMTVEARSWLDRADVVFYLLSDPASEVWIQRNYPASIDLAQLYHEYIQRYRVYEAMVERMLAPVREGKTVCAIFYGHPGVFVTPTHEAVETARSEGYAARMLPGVSATDCLFADLGFDPSVAGIQSYEATDLLVHRRVLHPESNVVIWQIGLVGNPTSHDDASKLPILVEYLYQFYDPDCLVAHYQGSVFAICAPVVEWLPLRELGRGAKVTNMSTLYIPPQAERSMDQEMVDRLGLNPRPQAVGGEAEGGSPEPAKYEGTPDDGAVAEFVLQAAADPELLTRFERSPEVAVSGWALSDAERDLLLTRMPGRIWAAIKHPSVRASNGVGPG